MSELVNNNAPVTPSLEDQVVQLTQTVTQQNQMIDELKQLIQQMKTNMLLPSKVTAAAAQSPAKQDEFESLKLLLESPNWPHAVDPSLICDVNSDQDKEDRAEGILDLIIDVHLENLKFLDFGCGEGHVVNKARLQKPKFAMGFDPVAQNWERWTQDSTVAFTTEWDKVKENGPYNVVLVYDVLDHILGNVTEVVEALRRIRSVTAPNAKIFVRCHPWCSRHGAHLYQKLNKAYAHVIFTADELKKLGYEAVPTREVIHPLGTYDEWFRLAGLKAQGKPQIMREAIEPFFKETPLIVSRIKSRWKTSGNKDLREGRILPIPQMEQQFVDYTLV